MFPLLLSSFFLLLFLFLLLLLLMRTMVTMTTSTLRMMMMMVVEVVVGATLYWCQLLCGCCRCCCFCCYSFQSTSLTRKFTTDFCWGFSKMLSLLQCWSFNNSHIAGILANQPTYQCALLYVELCSSSPAPFFYLPPFLPIISLNTFQNH